MNYKENNNECQMSIDDDFLKEERTNKVNYLKIPSNLERFINTSTEVLIINNHNIYYFYGYIEILESELICPCCGNKHLLWFKKLLYNHFDGIISHAKIKIFSGKIEGINNKVKTLRRQDYGYPDDEYFFLKLFDMSRN